MKQFTLLLELCQKTQKPLQSRDNSKSNPGKMKIRRTSIRNPGQKRGGSGNMKNEITGGVVKYDGLGGNFSKRMFFLSALLYHSFAIIRPPHENRGGLTYGS